MPRLVLLALLTVLVLGVCPCAAEDGEPPTAAEREAAKRRLAEDRAAFEARVNAAIDRGVAWLRAQQKPDGSFPGFSEDLLPRQYNIMEVGLNAFVMLTLAHCGATGDEKEIQRCLNFCRFHYSGGKGSWNLKGNGKVTIYTAATLVMALDALFRGIPPAAKIKRDRYGNPQPPKIRKCKYPAAIRKWIEELVRFIVANQLEPSGGWRYPGNPIQSEDGETDLSNVQYALLGLDAAASCGIPVPAKTWQAAAEYLLRTQETEGLEVPVWIENEAWEPGDDKTARWLEISQTQMRGWTYVPGQQAYATGAMTCAGVTCLGLVKERLWLIGKLDAPLRRRIDKGILDGLAWLSDTFTVKDNPDAGGTPQMWHYYYLYGLERTGAKVGVEHIGQHDWYREGAEHLLAAQEKDGGWKEAAGQERPADATESAVTQTCFALLFLRRSTRKPLVPMTPPVVTGGTPDK